MKQLSIKSRFYPSHKQEALLRENFGVVRWAYNMALDVRINGHKERSRAPTNLEVSRAMTELKKDVDYLWLAAVPATIITQSLRDSDQAFKNFFKGTAKFPRFKRRGNRASCRFQMDQRIDNFKWGSKFILPKLGNCKIKWSRRFTGRPKMATVTRNPDGKYYISVSVEQDIKQLPKTGQSVGIDLGINRRAALSNGQFWDVVNQTKKYEVKLTRAQRRLSRKTKNSNRWHRQRRAVASIHSKIANSRLDAIHKLTTDLVVNFDVICIETLRVKNMIKNHKLAKSLSDASFGKIVEILTYKAIWYGKPLIKIDQWHPSSQLCSGCNARTKMPLSERIYNCACGTVIDRDTNAALNILAEGIRSLNVEGSTAVGVLSAQQQVGPVKRIIANNDECTKAGAVGA